MLADLKHHQAMQLLAQRQHKQVIDLLEMHLKTATHDAIAHQLIAEAYWGNHQLADAVIHFQQTIKLDPTNPNPHFQIGNIFSKVGKLEEACQAYISALRLQPNAALVYEALAKTLRKMQAHDQAIKAYQRALKLAPQQTSLLFGLATLLVDIGETQQALEYYRQALEASPNAVAHAAFLLAMNYRPEIDAKTVSNCHRDWGRLHANPPLITPPSVSPSRTNNKKLRIGLVSSDFYSHPVCFYLESWLDHFDKNKIEIYCYAHITQFDEVSQRIRDKTHAWHEIFTTDVSNTVTQIKQDKIDILIDLSGQTSCKLLTIFSQKPAPIQVSWLGYFNTTGVTAIDYIISDPHSSPPQQQTYFVEQICRLPHTRFCYRPPKYAPEVSALPALQNGFITFGCFNNIDKLNEQVIKLWSDVLKACPNSKLMLKNKGMNDNYRKQMLIEQFNRHGITNSQLILRPTSPHRDLLASYAEVDIALDPFPFTGGLTTSEALWMGVPVVTLAGETIVSRQGFAFLTILKMTNCIAKNHDQYIHHATALYNDLSSLSIIRQNLREKMYTSALCDGKQFAEDLEQAFFRLIQ